MQPSVGHGLHRCVWHSHGAARQRDGRRCLSSWVELRTPHVLTTSPCLTMHEPGLVQLVHEHVGRGPSSQSCAAIGRRRSASVRVALSWGCTAAGRSTVLSSWLELCTSHVLSTSPCLTVLEPRLVQLVHEHVGRDPSSRSYAAIGRIRSASVRVALLMGLHGLGTLDRAQQLAGAGHDTRAEYLTLLDYA